MASALPRQVLEGIGNDIVNEIVLALGTHFKTGDLANSISYEITDDGKIQIRMLPYWKYLEYGTPGTREGKTSTVGNQTVTFGPNPNRRMPVRKEGNTWINMITNRPGDYALAKFIMEHGTDPYPFVRPVIYHKLPGLVKKNIITHGGAT